MKVLIIRSGPMEQYKKALAFAKEEFPEARLYVLTHMHTTTDVLDIESVWIYNYSSRKMGILRCGWECLTKMKEEKFDKIILLYTNPLGEGYDNVRFLAFSIGAKDFLAFDPQGKTLEIKPGESIITWLKEKLAFIYHGIIWCSLYIKNKINKIKNANRNRRS